MTTTPEPRRFDLLVVGAGTAGMACAITAAEAGARVGVMEKTSEVGGTLHVSAGSLSAAGTRLQRERGIEDSPELHFADVERISGGLADSALVRLAVENAAEAVDWLDELGFEFDPASPFVYRGYEPYSRARVYFPTEAGRSTLRAMSKPWEALVGEGRIVLFAASPLTDLVRDGKRVVGARAGDLELLAPATVLATGGYAASPELFAELTPGSPPLVSAARLSSTGDGIVVARRHGAVVRGGEHYLGTIGTIEQEPGSGRTDWWAGYLDLDVSTRPPREIHVNALGRRIVAEDASPAERQQALLEQPGNCLWSVFDEAALAGPPLVPKLGHDGLRAAARDGVFAWSAGTLEELGRRAGIDPAGLAATVESWNRSPEGAARPVATPPFYAIRSVAGSLMSFGGLAVDGELRVLDAEARPIPGLYAAGEVLGGGALMGRSFCTGMGVTPAVAFGRLLGRTLARTAASG